MTKLRGLIARLRNSEDGATMIEYSILIAIITALVIGLIFGMSDYVISAWSSICSAVGSGCTA